MTNRPRAFRVDAHKTDNKPKGVVIEDDPFEVFDQQIIVPQPASPSKGGRWFLIFISAVLILLLLGAGQSSYKLILELLSDSIWLGGVAIGAAVVAVLAALVILVREIKGITRERRIERLRDDAVEILTAGNEVEAKNLVGKLADLYGQSRFIEAQTKIRSVSGEIMAPEDRLIFAERELLSPIDAEAKRIVASAAKQVSIVTALSPRALVDLIFVIYAATRMLRQLSRLYGGRPGAWSFFRLAKSAFAHLAVTGGLAVGDGLLQQVFGLGFAAKISARLGEGALNGLMTARFGLAAISVCRPLPFIGVEPPRLGEVAGELVKKSDEQ
ncbi:TIGR01620 family protein [Microvirga sp. W0021]|uniref:TIGR01620 family protein n=1 Tax=Hohaiivirga grylli TaxID=3133970 RepID=A0ABV0BKD4_9HYPH